MLYSVRVRHDGIKGTAIRYEHFDTLQDAFAYYKKAITQFDYDYAGNDRHQTNKPVIVWDYKVEKNTHNFYTPEYKRIKKNMLLKEEWTIEEMVDNLPF